jgi:hypothetical protein
MPLPSVIVLSVESLLQQCITLPTHHLSYRDSSFQFSFATVSSTIVVVLRGMGRSQE